MTWTRATGNDVTDMVNLAEADYQREIDSFFCPEPIAYSRNLTIAVVNQFYRPNEELLLVFRSEGQLLAYTWARVERAPWSDDAMAMVKMAHIELSLSSRQRLRILNQMMTFWRIWAIESSIPIVCSTTMRQDQQAFLRLHERAGYTVRGSYCYLRV